GCRSSRPTGSTRPTRPRTPRWTEHLREAPRVHVPGLAAPPPAGAPAPHVRHRVRGLRRTGSPRQRRPPHLPPAPVRGRAAGARAKGGRATPEGRALSGAEGPRVIRVRRLALGALS